MKTKFVLPFVDILFTILLTFACITMLISSKPSSGDPAPQHNAIYQVIMTWSGDDDIDLHGQDPLHRKVSFQRREGGEGSLFSLNRDSLGASRTEKDKDGKIVNSVNEEIIAIRGAIAGEYIVNGHSYLKRAKEPVTVTVKLVKVKPFKEIKTETRTFVSSGEERTFFRFSLDKDGSVIETNTLPAHIVYKEGVDDPNEDPTKHEEEEMNEKDVPAKPPLKEA